MSDLEKEVEKLRVSRTDFDEHVNELYELRPLLEKCKLDKLLKEYDLQAYLQKVLLIN